MSDKGIKTTILFFFAVLLLSGCHAYILDDAQGDLRTAFSNGDMERSQKLLNKFKDKDIYRSKDQVLFNLEGGMIHHFSGNYDSSFTYLSEAERLIEDNYTKSISRGISSMLINDTKLVYDGEPYEDIYINAFNALNFIHQGDFQGALVETRRMTFKLEQMDIRIKGIADAFSKSDSTGSLDWSPGTVNVQNSAMAHYLSAVIYAKLGRFDDARIEQEKLRIALNEQLKIRSFPLPSQSHIASTTNPSEFNVLITAFSGQSPVKYQNDVRLYWDPSDSYLKFSLPSIRLHPSSVYSVRAVLNDNRSTDLEVIEEMDKVALDIYKAKEPVIYSRALLRTIIKSKGTNAIANKVAGENGTVAEILKFAGFIGMEATEKADLRGWQTLPGKVWMNLLKVPEGTNKVQIEYLGARGQLLYSESYDIEVLRSSDLVLLESLYSH
ncbi:hypothetical protein AB2B38_000585 [Balneola sp. MJW-20]|uniref:hypothetical protein n=1 Tax=Gracilimonas aurantiaca TaxID=3234185 RepID=UPI0034655A38